MSSMRVNADVKAPIVAKNLGISLSRFYYLERSPQDLTLGRINELSRVYGYSIQDVVVTAFNQLDLMSHEK